MNTKLRDSRFESLRIISMVMIVSAHYAWHGGGYFYAEGVNRVIFEILAIGGKLGVDLFVILSAWFLSEKTEPGSSWFRLIVKVTFYSLSIFAVHTLITGNLGGFSKLWTSFWALMYEYWFIIVYVSMVLLSPYINIMLHQLNQGQWKKLCFLLLLICCILPTIFIKSNQYISNLGTFLTLYIITAYLKKYGLKWNRLCCLLGIGSLLLIIVSEILLDRYMPDYRGYFLDEAYKLPIVFLAFSIFMLFVNAKAFYHVGINFIASSMIGVYLLHENSCVRKNLWTLLKCPSVYFLSPPKMILHMLFCLCLIFVAGISLDKLYAFFESKVIEPISRRLFSKAI